MIVNEIQLFLGYDWEAVQEGMRTALGTDISLLDITNRNLLGHPGKQLRPLLSLLVARACGGRANADSVRYAVASELLHNATLLHDDVADGSDLRRGEPTVRSFLGPNASVLIGDFWLVRAVRCVLEAERGKERVTSVMAGTLSDLAEGEMFQLQKASSCDTTLQDYLGIIYRKTASLFVATALAAAISVEASPKLEEACAAYGRYLGLAFQMRDDILDYLPSGDIGKPVGVDVMERKITLPLLCALDNVDAKACADIRKKVRDITPSGREGILEFARSNGGIEGAQKVLEEYSMMAVKALEPLRPSREKEWLEKLAMACSQRMK